MTYREDFIGNNTTEYITEFLGNISKDFDHYVCYVVRPYYLGKNVTLRTYMYNNDEPQCKISEIERLYDTFTQGDYTDKSNPIAAYDAVCYIKDGIMMNESSGYILFKKACKNCKYKIQMKNGEEKTSYCSEFDCPTADVTYVCWSHENKEVN